MAAKVYMFVQYGHEGCSIGNTIYLSKDVAEYELELCQKDKTSDYYNHPKDDCPWFVDEFELDFRIKR